MTTAVALAALADSPTRLRGIAHLRGHETDRLKALTVEINRLGGDAEETPDGLIVRPRPLHAGVVETYADHRMATFAAVLGLRVPDIEIVDVETTAKTMPGFVDLWTGMLASTREQGPRPRRGRRPRPPVEGLATPHQGPAASRGRHVGRRRRGRPGSLHRPTSTVARSRR